MAKSIIQKDKYCFICGTTYGLEEHHVLYGTANRKLSEKYGLKVWLCHNHHNEPPYGVHFNKDLDDHLKQIAQRKFEETYTENFREVFGKNYI